MMNGANHTVSSYNAVLYSSSSVAGFLYNLLVFIVLPRCDMLTAATLLLMRVQCLINILGLTVMGPLNTWVSVTGAEITNQSLVFVRNFPGAFLAFVTYTQFALQATMAINRYCTFQQTLNRKPNWFSDKKAKSFIGLCLGYGLAHGLMVMHPCCGLFLSPVLHNWTYVGYGAGARHVITVINDVIIYIITFNCYRRTFLTMKKLRTTTTKTAKSAQIQMTRERKVLLQFVIIACAWFSYSLFFRTLYFFPNATAPIITTLSELLRIVLFSIDPIIYLIFLKQLRRHLVCFVTRTSYTNTVVPTNTKVAPSRQHPRQQDGQNIVSIA